MKFFSDRIFAEVQSMVQSGIGSVVETTSTILKIKEQVKVQSSANNIGIGVSTSSISNYTLRLFQTGDADVRNSSDAKHFKSFVRDRGINWLAAFDYTNAACPHGLLIKPNAIKSETSVAFYGGTSAN